MCIRDRRRDFVADLLAEGGEGDAVGHQTLTELVDRQVVLTGDLLDGGVDHLVVDADAGFAGALLDGAFEDQAFKHLSAELLHRRELDVLAAQAYEDGKISRQDTLWSMEEKKVWSYLGQDGFHEIEVCEKPVLLKPEDKVLLMSKGIFEELSWREIEDILIDTDDSQKSADCLIRAAERKGNPQRDNGSVILIQRLEA